LGLLGDGEGEEEEGEDGETKTEAEDGDCAHQQQDRRQDVSDAAVAVAAVVAEYEGRLAALQREHADATAALAATHAAELAVARAALTTATASASVDGGAAGEGECGVDAAVAAQRRQYEGQMAALHAQLTALQQQHHTTTATSSAALTVGDVAAGLGAGEEGEDRAALRRRLRHAEARAAALTDQIRAMPPSLQVPPIYFYLGPYLTPI